MTDYFRRVPQLPLDFKYDGVEKHPKRTHEATHTTKQSKRRKRPDGERVGARVLLLNGIGEMLLVKERKSGKWNSPGGSKEIHETPQQCAIREMREECGIDFNQPEFTCVGEEFCPHFHTFVYHTSTQPEANPSSQWSTGDVTECLWVDSCLKPPADSHFCLDQGLKVCFNHIQTAQARCQIPATQPMQIEELDTPKPTTTAPEDKKPASPEPVPQQPQPAAKMPTHVFTEVLSRAGLQYLSKLTFKDFLLYFADKDETEMDETGDTMSKQQQHVLMKTFCKESMRKGKLVSLKAEHDAYEIRRSYQPTESSPTGRIFADGSAKTGLALQRLWSKVRSVLTRDYTIDLDMKNCHPTILLHKCRKYFPHEDFYQPLAKYVHCRPEFLDELSNAGMRNPKNLILVSMNSGYLRTKEVIKKGSKVIARTTIPKSCARYHSLDAAFKAIQKQLVKVPEYKDLDPGQRHPNRLGVFLNRILCQEENKLLQEAIQLVGQPQVVGPFFDGLLARGSEADVPNLLAKLNQRFQDRIIWDYKPHDNDIQIDLEYEGLPSHIADTDVTLMDLLVGHFSGKLARCRGALWFVGENCTTVILPGDRTQGALFEHHVIAELRLCEVFIGEHNQCDSMAALRSLCSSLMVQAPIDDDFEAKYWNSNPNDTYSQGICMWNERCIHLLQKSVFLYEESGEVEELKPDELQRNMRALTDVTFDQWCASSQRRAYDKDVFVPTLVTAQQNPKHYNRFKGLDIQYKDCCEVDVSACEPLLAHIREILCNGNEAASEFVLKTFARIIQGVEKGHLHWIKSQVCMIFLSKPGSGKGTVTRHFRRILGASNAKQVCKKKDVFGNFNELCMGKLWVELDELLWAGNHEQAGEFKNMITEDTQTCEGKYKKTREFDSYHNYCATTNSDWAAQIDGDDRRFAAIDCDDRWAGPRTAAKTDYFAKLNDPKQGPYNITLAFARYLYDLDVDSFEPAAHIPTETDGLRQQKLQSLNPVATLVLQWLERGSIQCANDLGEWVDDKYKIFDGVLHNEPITNDDIWRIVKAEGHSLRNFPDSSHKFFLALSKVLPSSCESCRVGRGKKYCKRFESLSSCRRDMNTYLGFPYF
eukprot:COSAG01_NODE_725_length_14049_cov_7.712760_4_plen_1101_part_00